MGEEIKAKIIIEADTSGAEEAAAALEKLQGMAGGGGEGGIGDTLAQQFEKGGEAAGTFAEALGGSEEALNANEEAFNASKEAASSATQAIEEQTQAAGDLQTAHEELQPTIEDTNKSLASMQETLAKSTPVVSQATKNMAVFQDAMSNPEPFNTVRDYLDQTGQSWSDFIDSVEPENANSLVNVQNNLDGISNGFVEAGKSAGTFTDTFTSTQAAMDEFNQADPWAAFNAGAQDAGKSVESVGAATEQATKANEGFFSSYFGGLGDTIFGGASTGDGGISAGLFSKGMTAAGAETPSLFEGAVMGFEQMARPLMMVQMVAQMATMMGQAIYNSAAIAEGSGAHGINTFTGAVDSLGYTMQQTGGQFSESFGKQFTATIGAINQALGDNSQGVANTGGMLGGALSFTGNLLMGGLGALLMATGVGMPLGFTMAQAGMEGIANNLAEWNGQPPEFTGQQATPAMEVGAQVQQGWSQIPTQVISDTAGSINNTNKILTEASDPQFIGAQNQLSGAQQYMQHVQQQYNAAHPYNQVQESLQSQSDYSTMNDQYNATHGPSYWSDAQQAASQGNWFGGFGSNQSGGGFFTNMWQALAGGPQDAGTSLGMESGTAARNWLGGIGSNAANATTGFFGGLGQDWNNFLGKMFAPQTSGPSPDMGYTGGVGAGAGVGSPGGMTNYLRSTSGGGTETVSGSGGQTNLSHTFTANVTWEANNLQKQFTAVANWAEQGVQHAVTAVANWTEQNVIKPVVAAAEWTEQNVQHAVTAAAEWTEQNVQHAVTAAAEWTEQNVIKPVIAMAEWTEQNVIHPVVAAAKWAEENTVKAFTATAQWAGQNLTHTFVGVAQWVTQTIGSAYSTAGAPMFAEGVSDYGGPAIIGEAGTELVEHNGLFALADQGPTFVNLPMGSSVYPMQDLSFTSQPRMLADGTGGSFTPIALPVTGGGSGAQTANIHVYLDSQTLISLLGANLMSSINVGMGKRSY